MWRSGVKWRGKINEVYEKKRVSGILEERTTGNCTEK